MKTLHRMEEIMLEKVFNAELTRLMNPKKRDDKLYEMKEFEEEREKLVELHQKKTTEMKSRHQKEEIKIEEGNNAELTNLMHSEKRKEKFEDIEEFVKEREKLMKLHDKKLDEMKSRHSEEEIVLDKEFNVELTRLMDKAVEIERL